MENTNKCFACDRKIVKEWRSMTVDTRDDQIVVVGLDCFAKVARAGEAGYQPPKGGPRLYLLKAVTEEIGKEKNGK